MGADRTGAAVQQRVVDAGVGQRLDRAVQRDPLADPAEVQASPARLQTHMAGATVDPQVFRPSQAAAGRGRVEGAAALAVDLQRQREHMQKARRHREAVGARRVQAREQRGRVVAGQFPLGERDLRQRLLAGGEQERLVLALQHALEARAHRVDGEPDFGHGSHPIQRPMSSNIPNWNSDVGPWPRLEQ